MAGKGKGKKMDPVDAERARLKRVRKAVGKAKTGVGKGVKALRANKGKKSGY